MYLDHVIVKNVTNLTVRAYSTGMSTELEIQN
jgi:hypothetical protein